MSNNCNNSSSSNSNNNDQLKHALGLLERYQHLSTEIAKLSIRFLPEYVIRVNYNAKDLGKDFQTIISVDVRHIREDDLQ